MISQATVFNAVVTLFSIAGIWVTAAGVYRWYRVDLFRHRVFMLRARLFDLARNGEISFDHPAYVNLRQTFNGFLRYADRIGFISTLLTSATLRRCPPGSRVWDWERDWGEAVDSVAPDVKAKLLELRSDLHFEIFKQLLFGSPLLAVTMLPALLVLFLRLAKDSLFKGAYHLIENLFKPVADPLDGFAHQIGGPASA